MAKGYWIGQVDVSDPEAFAEYSRLNQIAYRMYGGRYLIRGGTHEAVEGRYRSRLVVIEFPDYETAQACYRSPEYARAAAVRQAASIGDVVVVEGYDGPQPENLVDTPGHVST
ncbi:DUF1330 domain-containing protein [Cupriavidus taiwanensis]|uniref:DUF1330 domain-containing protein n=1 Tax=Cupriavidus taiwanensis TaxID=164546 RepID=UPI000E1B1113|nr:DUF1330 domain-containing protein [Cupriavidus taiwanensis]SOZ33507.1 conserved hypothetical protein [Cupriavidus taiwanensis]SPA25462.1 conserved hypothetical protein [Cupriavidus taiwanensis]